MRSLIFSVLILTAILPLSLSGQKVIELKMTDIAKVSPVDTVSFNGVNRAYILESNPLDSLDTFTIEVIFRPDSDGPTEQRFLHFGDMKHRVMFETRITNKKEWYFDLHYNSGQEDRQNVLTLIDSTLTHPTDKWYVATVTFDRNKITTYINGEKELEGYVDIAKFYGGKTAIGVRQNLVGWFKGSIYLIRVSEGVLPSEQFLNFHCTTQTKSN